MAENLPKDENFEEQSMVVSDQTSDQGAMAITTSSPTTIQKAELPSLVSTNKGPSNIKIAPLMSVSLDVSVLLGKTMMTLGDLLKLGPGSVIELNRLAGEPIDVLVNDRFFAKGEIVVVDETFGIRILEIAETPRVEAA